MSLKSERTHSQKRFTEEERKEKKPRKDDDDYYLS